MKNSLYYRELGQNSSDNIPIVILHGFLGSSQNWGTVGRDYSAHQRVILVDLRNHGRSFHAPAHSYSHMAGDVLSLMDELALECIHLVGHSMGGKVAMRLACDVPERVAKLIVVDIAPRDYTNPHTEITTMASIAKSDMSSRKVVDEQLVEEVGNDAMRQFVLSNLRRNASGEGFGWRVNVPVLEENIGLIRENPILLDDRYQNPVLLISGGRSRYVVPSDSEVFNEHFSDFRHECIEVAGHNPHIDSREEFVALSEQFFR